MPQFFTAGHLRLSILLAILGAVVALIFTIFSDSGIVALVARPIVSALIMFVVGTLLYALLASKVPEAIDVIENRPDDSANLSMDGSFEGGEALADDGGGSDIAAGRTSESGYDSYDSESGGSANSRVSDIPRKTGVQIGKEEITVNGVKFKNQPEVMAETIKQLMDQDKE